MEFVVEVAADGRLEIPRQILDSICLEAGDSLVLTAEPNGKLIGRSEKRANLTRRQIKERDLRAWIFSDEDEKT